MTEYKLAVIVTGVLQLYTLLMTEIIFRFVKALAVFFFWCSKDCGSAVSPVSHQVLWVCLFFRGLLL